MTISKPLLPPITGYVEVEVDGVRRYKNVETGFLMGEEPSIPTVDERITELEKENARLKAQNELQAQQQTFLEDCILEMCNVVYA